MKKISILILAFFLFIGASQNPRNEYIKQYANLAVKEMKRSGVPASITLAQGILESRSGQSELATKGNNHFGIKCHNDWTGKKMYKDDETPNECFRVYANVEESYKAHSDFLRNRDRYKFLFDLPSDDYVAWAKGLKKAGYATDPAYATKLIEIIEEYNLSYYDKDIKPEKESPTVLEAPKKIIPEEIKRNYKEIISFSLSRQIYKQNDVPFVYAIEGETYSSIANQNNLFLKEILKYNDLETETELKAGAIVYLARKKAQGPKDVEMYVVDKDGESLYEISQRFGIRYTMLLRYNAALYGKTLKEGDTVNLHKTK